LGGYQEEEVGKRLNWWLLGVIIAALVIGFLPTAAFAAPQPMSADGTIDSISGTVGFPTGSSGNYKVTSRTITGTFTSGDLNGDYSLTYKANVDLNTQAGNFNGDMTNGSLQFDVWGTSYPVVWTLSADSPVGYIGTSSVSGSWKGHGWPGTGTFSGTFSFVPTVDGHIDYIIPGSTLSLSGQWNLK
jgi:hypothetical protein